jgi:hypothetical protein
VTLVEYNIQKRKEERYFARTEPLQLFFSKSQLFLIGGLVFLVHLNFLSNLKKSKLHFHLRHFGAKNACASNKGIACLGFLGQMLVLQYNF